MLPAAARPSRAKTQSMLFEASKPTGSPVRTPMPDQAPCGNADPIGEIAVGVDEGLALHRAEEAASPRVD